MGPDPRLPHHHIIRRIRFARLRDKAKPLVDALCRIGGNDIKRAHKTICVSDFGPRPQHGERRAAAAMIGMNGNINAMAYAGRLPINNDARDRHPCLRYDPPHRVGTGGAKAVVLTGELHIQQSFGKKVAQRRAGDHQVAQRGAVQRRFWGDTKMRRAPEEFGIKRQRCCLRINHTYDT